MECIILILKGFVIGIANIIPGVSGGTLAITLGIYEKLIGTISHLFKNFKENLKFIIPIFIGMGLSILTMSNVIIYAFNHAAFATSLLFIGLIIGGIPLLYKKISDSKINLGDIFIFLATFVIVLMLAFSDEIFGVGFNDTTLNLEFIGLIKMLLIGIVASATMIIPGVSGSLVLMLLGYYTPILEAIKSLTHFENILLNIVNLGFFGVGIILGIVVIAKILEKLFKNYPVKTYCGVLGFVTSSIVAIPVSVIHEYGSFSLGPIEIICGIILLLIGYIIGNKLGE